MRRAGQGTGGRPRHRALARPLPPTERIRAHIDELFAADRPLPEILEEVARLGARLLMQARWRPRSPSSSAGTATSVPRRVISTVTAAATATGRVQIKTTAGPVELARPEPRTAKLTAQAARLLIPGASVGDGGRPVGRDGGAAGRSDLCGFAAVGGA